MSKRKHCEALYLISDTPESKRIRGSDDLIAKFNLTHVYDKFVRAYTIPLQSSTDKPVQVLDESLAPYIQDLPGRNDIQPSHTLRDIVFQPPRGADLPLLNLSDEILKAGFLLDEGSTPKFDLAVFGDRKAARKYRKEKKKRDKKDKKEKKEKKKKNKDKDKEKSKDHEKVPETEK